MAVKSPSILPELQDFVRKLPADTPYNDLLRLAGEANYTYSLQQTDAAGCADGSVLVTFQVLVGKAGDPRLEPYEQVSVKVGNAPGPVSLAARLMIMPTIVYLFFGRLPPAPEQQPATAPAPERTVDMSNANGADVVIDAEPEPAIAEEDDRDFPTPPPFVPEEPLKLDLVARREPDGVPIFVDLYAMDGELAGVDSREIVKALVEEMEGFIKHAESAAQILAIYDKNPDVMPFLQDFGTDHDRQSLAAVSKRKHAQLSTPPRIVNPQATARRRAPAARN